MTTHFDELIQIWHITTDEHVEWQKKKKSLSIDELFSYAQRLMTEEDEFDKKTEHMTDENPSFHASILAAKFKNHYAINRFLASVLGELCFRLMKIMVENAKARKQRPSTTVKKIILNKEMKREIAEQVKLEISKLKRDSQRYSTRKKTSRYLE